MITRAETADLKPIRKLLSSFRLPVSDIDDSGIEFWVYKHDGEVVGCVGLQSAGEAGLLRSLAVREEQRGTGVGKSLVHELLGQARKKGIKELYLLTETAASYFLALGFREAEKDSVPEKIRATKEFSALCPDSAVCMQLNI